MVPPAEVGDGRAMRRKTHQQMNNIRINICMDCGNMNLKALRGISLDQVPAPHFACPAIETKLPHPEAQSASRIRHELRSVTKHHRVPLQRQTPRLIRRTFRLKKHMNPHPSFSRCFRPHLTRRTPSQPLLLGQKKSFPCMRSWPAEILRHSLKYKHL